MTDPEVLLQQLSSSQGRRDQAPNLVLAEKLVEEENTSDIEWLIAQLSRDPKAIRYDSIKVLSSVAEGKPALLTQYLTVFTELLASEDNRLQWGAMTVVSELARVVPHAAYPHLSEIMAAAEKGSVITRDRAVQSMIHIAEIQEYREECFWLLLEILLSAPPNQFPSYAEQILPVVPEVAEANFRKVLMEGMQDLSESKRKRVEAVVRKLNQREGHAH